MSDLSVIIGIVPWFDDPSNQTRHFGEPQLASGIDSLVPAHGYMCFSSRFQLKDIRSDALIPSL
jgi:hypothetical protein